MSENINGKRGATYNAIFYMSCTGFTALQFHRQNVLLYVLLFYVGERRYGYLVP